MIRPLAVAPLLALALAACSDPPSSLRPDATPLACASATVHARYRVDGVTLARTSATAKRDGFDVIGDDGIPDNQLGQVFETVVGQFGSAWDPTPVTAAALAAGVDWEIETETCADTGETRVRMGSGAGLPPRAGGTQAGETITAAHGCAEVPVGAITGGADAGWVTANELAVALTIGDQELTGTVGFALDESTAQTTFAVAFAPFLTQEEALPSWHATLQGAFDPNDDGTVSPTELEASTLFQSITAPDSHLQPLPPELPRCPTASTAWLSFGVAIHAVAESPR